MMKSPEITIIMATYNRANYIVEALQSIKKQTFKNWECLIIDDGCTDNTDEIIKTVLEEDKRFNLFIRPKTYSKGLSGARNYGLDLAKGNYIIFFDDDDVVHPLNLQICFSVFCSSENISFCNYRKESFIENFNYNLIDYTLDFKLKPIDNTFLYKVITNTIPLASCTVLWQKECFEKHRFNEDLMYAEEWECYSRILSENIKGLVIDKVLYFNRKHSKSNTGEFWNKSKIRIDSKKRAIELIVLNLLEKNALTANLAKYLLNLAISFRDFNLIKKVLKALNLKKNIKLFYIIKFYLYPIWLFYKKINRKN